jgi:membrane fusion protein (multidrug efflux system)
MRQLKEMRGQVVQKGALIAKVFDYKTLTVEIAVPEKEIGDVRIGQPVILKARAYPEESFYGSVVSIATSAGQGSGTLVPMPGSEKSVLVTTQIENRSLLLKPEMTGEAKISCGSERVLGLIGNKFAHTVKVEFWSWW